MVNPGGGERLLNFSFMRGRPVEVFQEKTVFCEPMQSQSVCICSTRRMWSRKQESEKQLITGYEIMTSIGLSTERLNGYEVGIMLQDANTLRSHPQRR
jgi:hypothetical protein